MFVLETVIAYCHLKWVPSASCVFLRQNCHPFHFKVQLHFFISLSFPQKYHKLYFLCKLKFSFENLYNNMKHKLTFNFWAFQSTTTAKFGEIWELKNKSQVEIIIFLDRNTHSYDRVCVCVCVVCVSHITYTNRQRVWLTYSFYPVFCALISGEWSNTCRILRMLNQSF